MPGVDSVTFRLPPRVFHRYCAGARQSARANARDALGTPPSAYNGCAEGRTMANKHTGSRLFLNRQRVNFTTRVGSRAHLIIYFII